VVLAAVPSVRALMNWWAVRYQKSLIERKLQLVIQTRKSGNSKQARKLCRLNDAGRLARTTTTGTPFLRIVCPVWGI